MNNRPFLASLVVVASRAAGTAGFAPSRPAPSVQSSPSGRTSRTLLRAVAADGVANGTGQKKVLVLGGDGFCGWPTSLYLSDQGHDVVMVDNLSRRNIDTELGCDSLTPIQPPGVSVPSRASRVSLAGVWFERCPHFTRGFLWSLACASGA